jgi:hypothetical protein
VDSRCDALRDPPIIRCRFVRPQPKSKQNLRVAEVQDSVSNLLRNHDIHQRKSVPANAQIRLVEHLAPVVLDHLTDGVRRRLRAIDDTARRAREIEATFALTRRHVRWREACTFRCRRIPREDPPEPLRRRGHA